MGDSVSVEYRVRHKDGRLLHVMGNIKLVEENGERFYQRFLLDCTAQKIREEEERTEKERQHMALEALLLHLAPGLLIHAAQAQDDAPALLPGARAHGAQKIREEEERTEKERQHMALVQALSIDYTLVCFFDLDTGRGYPPGRRPCSSPRSPRIRPSSGSTPSPRRRHLCGSWRSTDEVEAYLQKIMTSGNHLLSLINDILDMSRIESGKMHLEEAPCSLPDILHGLRNAPSPPRSAGRSGTPGTRSPPPIHS